MNGLVRKLARVWWLVCCGGLGLLAAAFFIAPVHTVYAQSETDFLPPEQAFRLSVALDENNGAGHSADANLVAVHFDIAPDYYLYRSRFAFETVPSALLGAPQFAAGEQVDDPTFGEVMEVYRSAVTVKLPVKLPLHQPASLPEGQTAVLTIVSQGCAQAGLCYPPMRQSVTLRPSASGWTVQGEYARTGLNLTAAAGSAFAFSSAAAVTPSPPPSTAPVSAPAAVPAGLAQMAQMNDEGVLAWLRGISRWQVVGFSFLLGVLLSFTPCVLPMVPILLSLIAGQSTQHHAQGSRWRGLSLALAYVMGVSIVYTLLGVAAALLGASLNQWLQTPWVMGVFAVLLALLGVSMLGAFTLQTPGRWQRTITVCMNRLPGGRLGAVLLMGMLSALVVGACVVAPLAGLLLFISQTGQVMLGAAALFALAWGAGLPLLLVGAGAGALLPRAGGWMQQVNTVFGVLLLATAWWMVSPFFPASWAVLGWALLAVWTAVLLGAWRSWTAPLPPLPALGRAVGLALAFWAALMLVSVGLGTPSVVQPLRGLAAQTGAGWAGWSATAGSPAAPAFRRIASLAELDRWLARATKPVMLDFYADWCVACKEMEQFTFSDAAVARRMAQFDLLQVDVTAHSSEDRALLQRFNLYGPPGILFFDAGGQYLPARRVIGFKNAGQFGATLDGVLAQARR